MSKKHLDYLLTLNSYNRKLKIVAQNNYSAFLEVKSKITVFKQIQIDNYKRAVIELELLPETIVHLEKDRYPLFGNPFLKWPNNKLRVSSAYFPIKDSENKKQPVGHSVWDCNFNYIPGNMLFPKRKYSKAFIPCQTGIHCFLTWQEAKDYVL